MSDEKEVTITLDDYFTPRHYQLPVMEALETKKYRKLLLVIARRAGKDVVAWNLLIRQAIIKPGLYLYCLPKASQARTVIFEGRTLDGGKRFIDFIPKELIKKINGVELKITLLNGSIIKLTGSDNYDRSIVGSGAQMIIFSEWSLCDPDAFTYARPIFMEKGHTGQIVFLSTPRGKNHLFDMYNRVKDLPDWYTSLLTIKETGHISEEEVQKEIDDGEISWEKAQQEYYCSFNLGVEGAFYAKYIDKLRFNDQIGKVNYIPSLKVHTAWDIGIRDNTSIVFYQLSGMNIHIIDAYEKSKEGLEHYVEVINSKPWAKNYGKHIGPHDLMVHEFTSGVARIQKARELGVHFTIAPKLSIEDGIEAVRTALPKMYIDEKNCAHLIRALENYRQEYDAKNETHKPFPVHDKFSHFCDAIRYLSVSLSKLRDGMTAEDAEELKQKALNKGRGYQGNLNNQYNQSKGMW